ncbi:cilia- and flagella-associated protein 206-like [Erpetoichthys calabaricus]|uniref:cilia- and flagella-associated protein 206-like n=1 Tax=Erpetoichthys calabaricus TaxID=27687 RepID=UPI0022341C3C|nr:cilia- and flagella-associated protein 206-like [Erpetoichthys calabaricus]
MFKMSHFHAKNIIKIIIREIIEECANKGQQVSETLVAFIVKAVVLDPRNEFHVDKKLTKYDIQNLINICVYRLLDQNSPSLNTIKMQIYFDMNYAGRNEYLNEHHIVLESNLSPVSRDITDIHAKNRQELEAIYHKIVSFVLLCSGLGASNDIDTVVEATVALQSVFPRSMLASFLSLKRKEKEQQLRELTMIVTGIRLYNKDVGKGGESIDNLPAILNNDIPTTSNQHEAEMELSLNIAERYTTILEKLENGDVNKDLHVYVDLLKEALYNIQQHVVFLRLITSEIITCAQQVEFLQQKFGQQMEELKSIVQDKIAVPTADVYPHFIALSHLWYGFQGEIVLLSVFNSIATSLKPYLSSHAQIFSDNTLGPLLENLDVKTNEQRVEETSSDRIDPSEYKDHNWLFPETTHNFDSLPLQFGGICAYTLIEKNGLLLMGNPKIGILKHNDKYYSFSSKKAAKTFAENPDKYIWLVIEMAKQHAELIQLLELLHQFEPITPYTGSATITSSTTTNKEKGIVRLGTTSDISAQTETHLLPSHIVKSYEWNEWELRRKAIKLANLRNKVTHSMQTKLSHLRRENISQVYLPKQKAAQTKKINTTNVPKIQVIRHGFLT